MMDARAIDAAYALARMPTLAPVMRERPIPDDILTVILLAAGEEAAGQQATQRLSWSMEEAAAACRYYLQQVVLYPGAPPLRMLAANPETSHADVRRNRAALVKWLHPDHNKNDWEAALFLRVNEAFHLVESGRNTVSAPPPAAAVREGEAYARSMRWVRPSHMASSRRPRPRRRWAMIGGAGLIATAAAAGAYLLVPPTEPLKADGQPGAARASAVGEVAERAGSSTSVNDLLSSCRLPNGKPCVPSQPVSEQ